MKIRATLIELWNKVNPYKERENVFWNGETNQYPAEIERVVGNSPTGSRAVQMFSKFIYGKGISEAQNVEFHNGTLLSEVVKNTVDDIALQNGAFLHIGYGIDTENDTLLFVPKAVKSLSYDMCRISNNDDDDNEGMILHKHFTDDVSIPRKEKKREMHYYPFSNNQKVIREQIRSDAKRDGYEGDDWTEMIRYYRGQIMYINLTPKFRYAVSKFDAVFLDLDSEHRIGVYVNQFARGGFLGKTAILTKGLDSETAEIIKETIEGWLGAEGSGGVAHFDVEQAESLDEIMKVLQIPSQFDHEQFEVVLQNIKRHILGAANNLPEGLAFADSGALFAGSGESYKQMKQFYWEQCEWERQKIEEAFWKLGFEFNFLPLIEEDDTVIEE